MHYTYMQNEILCGGHEWSVINGYGSYGGVDLLSGKNQGLLEIMACDMQNEPMGFLTAEQIIENVI